MNWSTEKVPVGCKSVRRIVKDLSAPFGLSLAGRGSGTGPRHLITALKRLGFEIWQQEPVISRSDDNCTLACVGGSAVNYKDEVQSSEKQLVLGFYSQKQTQAAAVTGEDRDTFCRMSHDFFRLMPSENVHFLFWVLFLPLRWYNFTSHNSLLALLTPSMKGIFYS